MPLPDILKKTPFVVVDGVATRLYMPERTTLDLDILVLAEDREICEEELRQAGCKKVGDLSIGGATWTLPDGTELDGWELRAAWDDFKIGLKHGNEFAKIAIYGNKRWQEMTVKGGAWFMTGEIQYFEAEEDALRWLTA
ncbi:MAG: hypothetical protein DSY80_07560 [Desulfocapsa sp.]|nr:MAG: hypothetical protein DSY80_07560 [Desulfocapsa sp.]